MSNEAARWSRWITMLPLITTRLRNVTITRHPAIKIMRRMDSPATLHYVDPPYISSTRKSSAKYIYEMTLEEHQELLEYLQTTTGMVVLSGYANELYDKTLSTW